MGIFLHSLFSLLIRLDVYVDDELETGHLIWSGADGAFSATKGHRLIVGGLPSDLQQSTAADSVITTKQGLNGCVKDIAFIDDR